MKLKNAQTRLACESDATEIAKMAKVLIEHGLPWTWQAPRIVRAIQHADTNCAVTTQHGKLAAFAIVDFGSRTAHLNLLAVNPLFQRMGLGKHLIKWHEIVAKTAGIQTIFLEVRKSNITALLFYSDLGYSVTKSIKNYYSNSEDALRMAHYL